MNISIIGAGNMGGALALGLSQGSIVAPEDITISNPSTPKLEAIKASAPAIRTTTDNRQCIAHADVVILAVKPWKLAEVADELRTALADHQAICSMVGGVGLDRLGELFPGRPLYYLIPNTAIATHQSMTFMASRGTKPEMDQAMLLIFRELGDAMLVEERLMNAGMVLASCGIAYALRYVRAATEGGVQLGFRAAEAQHIVAQTLRGAASLLDAGGHAEAEIDKVTTPGGLTIRGLNAMEQAGFTNAVISGLLANKL
ncbi:MAG: NAD(P)-binding domain-containing protein [Bacteroidaceae bacterium]|nr:NAD(P)-binding domain-containing protein [Bacteroidaceae bacterium]